MNKYLEVFYTITDWFHAYRDHNGVLVNERHITPYYEEAKHTIKELVEKSNPKDVIGLTHNYMRNVGYLYSGGYCPNCNKFISCNIYDPDHILKYCSKCGQALNWRSDKEVNSVV